MLNSLTFGMKHACYIVKTAQDFKINFITGSAVFGLSQTVSGETSGATGLIKTVYVSSGAWESGTAAGYLIVSFISGIFQGGENISDDGETAGQANLSGVQEGITDSFGVSITTTLNNYSICSFDDEGGTSGGIQNLDGGPFIVKVPLLFLPPEADILEGDQVQGLSIYFNKLYKVKKVRYPAGLFSDESEIDHIEAVLELIEKREG
jgi:hypothetical protein